MGVNATMVKKALAPFCKLFHAADPEVKLAVIEYHLEVK